MDFDPDYVKLMTKEEINEHSKIAWKKLYAEVEQLAGRYDPLLWAQFVADQFRRCRTNFELFRSHPPHYMLRSIEANAANWKPGRSFVLKENRFLQVMRKYIEHKDPLLLSFAATDLTAFLLLMTREQIEIQIHYNQFAAARLFLIYVLNSPLPKTSLALKKAFGINALEWLQLCFVAFSVTDANPQSRVDVERIRTYVRSWIDDDTIYAFLRRACWTVPALGDNYRKTRVQTPDQFHSFIRSAFLEKPILDYGEGRLLAPEPKLIFDCMGNGLYRMLGELWKVDSDLRHEFSKSMESYIGRLLGECRGKVALHTQETIKKLANAKSCDFILETDDLILLVESKGVAFERRLLFPKIMQEDSSTTKIIDAGEQLRETFDDLRAGKFDTIVADRNKAVRGIVATYAEIPYANSDWYMEQVICPRASFENRKLPSTTFGLPIRPIIMALEVLEMFIVAVSTLAVTPLDLFKEKEEHNQMLMGVWGDFLRRKLDAAKVKIRPFEFVDDANAEFLAPLITPAQSNHNGNK